MIRTILLAFCITLSSVLFSQGNSAKAKYLLMKSADKLRKTKAVTYGAEYYFKSFDNTDTLKMRNINTTIAKRFSDSVLGYYARVKEGNDFTRLYDGAAFYLINHVQKSILRDNPRVTGKNFTRNNILRDVIPSFLFSKAPYSAYLDTANKLELEDNPAKSFYTIIITFPKDEEITDLKIYLFLDKKNLLPTGYESKAVFRNIQYEYRRIDLKKLTILPKQPSFILDSKAASYVMTDFKSPLINYDLLPIGAAFPEFSVKDINGQEINYAQLQQNKIILLSFWYTACAPCIREFPFLIELNNEFRDRGLKVVGMNSYDTTNEMVQNVKTFAKAYKLNYSLYTCTKEIDSKFLVKIYPTVYLVKNGTIIYRHYGYSEDNNTALKQAIIDALND